MCFVFSFLLKTYNNNKKLRFGPKSGNVRHVQTSGQIRFESGHGLFDAALAWCQVKLTNASLMDVSDRFFGFRSGFFGLGRILGQK